MRLTSLSDRVPVFGALALALLLSGTGANAAEALTTLIDVRIGPHKRFDRVVFEFQSEVTNRVVTRLGQRVEVRFSDVRVLPGLTLPRLPVGLSVLTGIDMAVRSNSGVVFTLTLGRDAVPSELALAGEPWRLAIDLSPRVAETREEEPEYIPGDLPIPTIFGHTPESEDTSSSPQRALAILSFFYLAQGDTAEAQRQAVNYRNLTGEALDMGLPVTTEPQSGQAAIPIPPHAELPLGRTHVTSGALFNWGLMAVVFAAGFLGGFLASRLNRKLKMPELRFLFRRAPKSPKALVHEVESSLQSLREAVSKETAHIPAASARANEADSATSAAVPSELEPAPVAEDEVRESLMDRRVKRVLELAREGRNVAAIAEELEMGQDEVKLILDLNQ